MHMKYSLKPKINSYEFKLLPTRLHAFIFNLICNMLIFFHIILTIIEKTNLQIILRNKKTFVIHFFLLLLFANNLSFFLI